MTEAVIDVRDSKRDAMDASDVRIVAVIVPRMAVAALTWPDLRHGAPRLGE